MHHHYSSCRYCSSRFESCSFVISALLVQEILIIHTTFSQTNQREHLVKNSIPLFILFNLRRLEVKLEVFRESSYTGSMPYPQCIHTHLYSFSCPLCTSVPVGVSLEPHLYRVNVQHHHHVPTSVLRMRMSLKSRKITQKVDICVICLELCPFSKWCCSLEKYANIYHKFAISCTL